jgi:hypothetical protein
VSSKEDPSRDEQLPGAAARWSTRWSAWLYERAPTLVEDAAKRLLPLGLPLLRARVPVTRLTGTASLGRRDAAVVTAGARPSVDDLPDRFFEDRPEREELGRCTVVSLSSQLQSYGESADWVVARVDHISSRLWLGRGFLRVPESVGSWLEVPEDPAGLVRANHSVKEDMRIVRREQLVPELSRSKTDCDLFFRDMHVPFMQNRHGDVAVIRELHQLRRGVHRGGILFVRRGGTRIAGVAFQTRGGTMHLLAVGTLRGDPEWVRTGALAAIYYFSVQHACEQRCARIDFGGVSPVLSDGLLRYKKKWGIRLAAEPHTPYDYLVRWDRPDALLLRFLARNPLIFRQGSTLAAVVASGAKNHELEDDARRLHRDFFVGGLGAFYVLADVPEPRLLSAPDDSSVERGGKILVRTPQLFMQELGLIR